jgi:hypothetical protein
MARLGARSHRLRGGVVVAAQPAWQRARTTAQGAAPSIGEVA